MKELMAMILLVCLGLFLLLVLVAAAQPGGVLHAGILHASAEKGVVLCAPWDEGCQGNPFDYPAPGGE